MDIKDVSDRIRRPPPARSPPLLQGILLRLQLVDLPLLLSDLHATQVEIVVDLVLERRYLLLDVGDLGLDVDVGRGGLLGGLGLGSLGLGGSSARWLQG